MNDEKIHEFWNVFSSISEEVLVTPNDDKLIAKIDSSVRDLGDYDWEYGPSQTKRFYFALSPNLQIHLLEEVDYIVSLAPAIDNWEIISCKPKKKEFLEEWEILNERGEKIIVNTKNWKCVIYKFPDDTIELDVVIENVDGNDEIKYLAVDIHLSNILGERKYIQKIKTFSILNEFPEDIKKRAVRVRDLDKYI